MAQRALTPEGGKGDHVGTRLPRGERDRVDGLARRRGLTRAEFVRAVLLDAVAADEPQEVAAQAS